MSKLAQRRYTVVIPVNCVADAKLRLHPSPRVRRVLTSAMALDVVMAAHGARSVERVVLVGNHSFLPDAVPEDVVFLGQSGEREGGSGQPNSAIRYAARVAAEQFGDPPLAVLPSDLACLTSATIDQVLGKSQGLPAFCADLRGRGTTIFISPKASVTGTSYGPDSAARHRRVAAELRDAPQQARLDVDTLVDLARAQDLGSGPHTNIACADWNIDLEANPSAIEHLSGTLQALLLLDNPTLQ